MSRANSQLWSWLSLTLWIKLFLFSTVLNSPPFYKPILGKVLSESFLSFYLLDSRFPLDTGMTMRFLKSPRPSWWTLSFARRMSRGPDSCYTVSLSSLHVSAPNSLTCPPSLPTSARVSHFLISPSQLSPPKSAAILVTQTSCSFPDLIVFP